MSMRTSLLTTTLAASLGLAVAGAAQAATEVEFWHSMTGALNTRLNELTDEFNASQSEYKVNPTYKGAYGEALNAGIAAFRAGNAPHILQVFEVGTATMMHARGAVKPVSELMVEAGQDFDTSRYIPAVAGYYTAPDGRMMSFPFNSSTPVFYYNKDAFKRAGLDPEQPPKTWAQVEDAARKIVESGAAPCGFTTSWPSWVQAETFSAWHNTEFATRNNGFDGLDARLAIDSDLHVRHIDNLARLSKEGLFGYGGRGNLGDSVFYSGQCAMSTASSSAQANIGANAQFDVGISTLPYYDDVAGAPQNTIIGGASLWVFNGKPADEYKAVAAFLEFLSGTDVQARWHQQTGYLPITTAAYEQTKASGFYDSHPGADVSVEQMIVKTTDKSRGVRLGNLPQIRDIIEEEFELIWAGKQDARQGLTRAVERGNEVLTRFERSAGR